jgi:hypothetical protein
LYHTGGSNVRQTPAARLQKPPEIKLISERFLKKKEKNRCRITYPALFSSPEQETAIRSGGQEAATQ